MIETKTIEMRDKGTFIPMLAIRVMVGFGPEGELSQDDWLLRKAGWGENFGVYLMPLHQERAKVCFDPYGWNGGLTEQRTYSVIHKHLELNWNAFKSGDVLDVQYLLRETTKPKVSERETS